MTTLYSPPVRRAVKSAELADGLATDLTDYAQRQACWVLVLLGAAGLLRARAIRRHRDASRLWLADMAAATEATRTENSSGSPEPPEAGESDGDAAAGG